MADRLVAELEAWAARPDAQVPPAQVPPEQVPSETAASGSAAQLAMSLPLRELFPELAETYPAAAQPRERVQLLLDRYHARIDPRPDGFEPLDLVQSANNLLSLGIMSELTPINRTPAPRSC